MNDILKEKKIVYLVYTGLFCLLFFFCFEIWLLVYHKSILWSVDTFEMHYIPFLCFGRWIRNGIVTGEFPLWNPAIGYGADFLVGGISTLCDPLCWLAVILPERLAEEGFHLATFLRLYFCGLAFTWFGLRRNQPPYAVLCGAILYTFSAYAYLGLFQSGFLIALVALPLLTVGTDELFEKKKAVLYVVTLSCCALNSFYVTYMLALLVIAYFFLKFCFLPRNERTFSHLLRLTGRFLLFSLWAVAIAAASLVPAAMLMAGMSRLGLKPFVPVLYDKSFYIELYRGIITSFNMLHRDGEIGFSVLAVVCVLAFFLSGRLKSRKSAVAFLLMSVGLCIPWVGHAMNGFSYIANRWVWAYNFVVAWTCTLMLPDLRNLDKRTVVLVLSTCFLYALVGWLVFRDSDRFFLVMSFALLVTALLLFFFPRLSERQYQRAILCLTCVTVILPAYFQFSKNGLDWFSDNIPTGEAYDLALESGGMPLLNRVDTSDGTRYNNFGLPVVRNASLLYRVSGTELYNNLYNSSIDDFHNSIALHTEFHNFGYAGLDRRSELLALLGVNHFFTETAAASTELPLGFDIREAEMTSGGRQICAYRPSDDYSLFSFFRDTISREEYEKLTPVERQQVLLQACVLDTASRQTQAANLKIEDTAVPYRFAESGGLAAENGQVLAADPYAFIVLRFAPQTEGELYLSFENLVFENGDDTGCWIDVEALSDDEVVDRMTQSLYLGTNRHHMYGGKHNWLLNLGYIGEPIDALRIIFRDTGTYSFRNIYVDARSPASVLENIARLQRGVQQVSFSPDAFSLTVNTEEDGLLFTAVPYDRGWQATDNGEPVEIQCADLAFMAVKLGPGTHNLVFRYHNQSLIIGLVISLVALTGYIAFEIGKRKQMSK